MNTEVIEYSKEYYMDIATELMLYHEYEKAIMFFSYIIENDTDYFPAYWGRMLCSVQCNDESELIAKGINIENHPDYLASVGYASLDERLQLEYVKNCCIMPIENANEILMYCKDYYANYYDVKKSFDELESNPKLDESTNKLLEDFKEAKLIKEQNVNKINKLKDFRNYKYFLMIIITFVGIVGIGMLGAIHFNDKVATANIALRIIHRICLYLSYGFIAILGTFCIVAVVGIIFIVLLLLVRKFISLFKKENNEMEFSVFREIFNIVKMFVLTTVIVLIGLSIVAAVILELVFMDEIVVLIAPFTVKLVNFSILLIVSFIVLLLFFSLIDSLRISTNNTEMIDKRVFELQKEVLVSSHNYINKFNEEYKTNNIYGNFIQYFEKFL